MASSFRDKWKIERMSPGHCTGQFVFSEFIRVYGSKFDQAGLGSVNCSATLTPDPRVERDAADRASQPNRWAPVGHAV